MAVAPPRPIPSADRAAADKAGSAAQVVGFRTGNEIAALSAKQINFHLMGYYPITPSTEIAEVVDEMKAAGEHQIVMVPADGEHSAAGICFGAAAGGGRVFNATSSQGLLYQLEELPVRSGTRYPMLLDLATRAVSGPLDIRGDHSDVLLRAQHRLADLHGARSTGCLRPESDRAARRRASRRPTARDGGIRWVLHKPSETPGPTLQRTTLPCRSGSDQCGTSQGTGPRHP